MGTFEPGPLRRLDSCATFADDDMRVSQQIMPGNFQTEYHYFLKEKLPASSFESPKDTGSKAKNSEPIKTWTRTVGLINSGQCFHIKNKGAKKQYAKYKTKEYQDKIIAEFGDSAVFI